MKSSGYHLGLHERLLAQLKKEKGTADHVLQAMRSVPRHFFVNPALEHKAYEDMTLPTSDGQTISQPAIVAQMTELLDVKPGMKVLEIGTGSGYQASILAQYTEAVFTIERVSSLAINARQRFRDLGFNSIICREGDGTKGWPDRAPFHRIIVTAGAPVVPKSLLDQLAPGGKLLIPTGSQDEQVLELYTVNNDRIVREKFNTLLFVPLVGEEGWKKGE